MEVVIFCGIQATGKTTFFKEQFFRSHIRISLDQLNTRNKEQKFIETCIATQHPFVIDNTNPTKEDRQKYITIGKEHNFKIIGYYFKSNIKEALVRNNNRQGKEKIPDVGVLSTYKKLELPTFDEGFDEIFYVELNNNEFKILNWKDEI